MSDLFVLEQGDVSFRVLGHFDIVVVSASVHEAQSPSPAY